MAVMNYRPDFDVANLDCNGCVERIYEFYYASLEKMHRGSVGKRLSPLRRRTFPTPDKPPASTGRDGSIPANRG